VEATASGAWSDQEEVILNKQSVLPYLLRKVRRRIPSLILMTAANVGSAFFGVIFALGTRNVINSATSGSKAAFLSACLQQGGIILAIVLCLTLYRHLHAQLTAVLDRDWKQDLLHHLLHGDYEKVSAYHSGELINRLNNDVRAVNEGLLATLPGLASMVTRLGAVLAVLTAMDPLFTLVMAAAGVVVVTATAFARKKLKTLNKRVSESEGKVSGFMQEVLEKLLLVQAMDVSKEVERRTDALLADRYDLQRRRKNVSLLSNTCVSVLAYGSGFAALVWCAAGILNGTMTFGDLTAVTQLVSQLQGPFVNLSGFLPKYIAMTAACERLMELDSLSKNPESVQDTDVDTLYASLTSIRAGNLTFSYGRDHILKDTSFTLPKGAFAVVVGPSGIGKSTILKLLLGIFHPESGSLCLETDKETVPVSAQTRKLFAYVPQGNLLFSGTLRENLTLTCPDADEASVHQAIYVSCMDTYLSQLPDGLDTVLGENAHGLSEGQAQRLAIARAVLGGAPILLLDEITSALDAETEQLVLSRLSELPNRTIIAVTHRPAAIALADWILTVDGGKINAEKRV